MSESNENATPEEEPVEIFEDGENPDSTSETDKASKEPAEELSPLEAATAERDKFREQLLRTAADFENYRKRARRDVEDARRRAKEDVLREVVMIIDNLERAVEAADAATDPKQVAEGVEMVLRSFDEVANRVNMKRQDAVGQPFDPALHDAVQQIESAEHPIGTVAAQIRPGYMLDDRLLRPAMVVVSKGRPAGAPEPSADGVPDSDEDDA